MKKIFIGLICVFALSLFFSYKSYAVSDLSVTLNSQSSMTRGDSVFSNCDSTCIHQYNYLIVDFNVVGAEQANYGDFRLTLDRTGFSSTNFWISPFDTYLVIDDLISNIKYYSTSIPAGTITITLSETLPYNCPDCPDCPEPEPQEPCPDPEENSRFIQVVLDAFWKYHMVFAGAVAGLIAIFVVYRIIKGMLR